jgi:hypothetical protein
MERLRRSWGLDDDEDEENPLSSFVVTFPLLDLISW